MYKIPCKKCAGHGVISSFAHVENGVCFQCYGSKFQEVSEIEYKDYQAQQALKAQGKYIVFNNGNVEYYKTVKEIENKYGNFFSGSYGDYSTQISYNDKNIVYTKHTTDSEEFLNSVKAEYNKRNNAEITSKIEYMKGMLKVEKDADFIVMLKEQINTLKNELKAC